MMTLSKDDLFLLCQCAISAAFQAGQIISQYSQQPIQVNHKQGGNSLASQVVTEVDHLSQEVILQVLLRSCDLFDLALLSEESDDDQQRLVKDYFWCIDPLDGTLPFIESKPGYSVSIALVSKAGLPVLGIIYDPLKQTLYSAIKGQGAFRNGKPFKSVTKSAGHEPLTIISDKSIQQHSLYPSLCEGLELVVTNGRYTVLNSHFQGGAAMNALQVLDLGTGCYVKLPKPESGGGSLWDYAATACVFNEIGAHASDIFGKPLRLNCNKNTFMNHCGILYSNDLGLAESIIDLYQIIQ